MSDGEADELTVTIFQQGLVARTFRVRRSWFYRLSLSALGLVLLTAASLWLAVRYFRVASRLEQRAAAGEELVQAPSPPPPAALGNYLFSALPANVQAPPDRASLPFSLKDAKVRWAGHLLQVRFALQYTLNDGGGQQGRLILLARGQDTLQVYPYGAFSPSGKDPLILPDRGESFSVSRYREVRADFGPAKTRESFQEVEVLVFDNNGALLIHERLVPEPASASGPEATP